MVNWRQTDYQSEWRTYYLWRQTDRTTSGANTTVSQIISATHYMANTGYVAGETLTVKAANGVTRAVTASVTTVGQGRATLQKFKTEPILQSL